MPWSGTGTFTRVYSWVADAANGIFVRADRTDTDSDDIANGISNCIAKDGQSTINANIPFNNFKITGLATGSAAADAVNYLQVFTAPVFANPTFTGAVTASAATTTVWGGTFDASSTTSFKVPTATPGTNDTHAASTAFAVQLAFQTALPSQAGNATKSIVTNGVTAFWGTPRGPSSRVFAFRNF